MTSPLPNAPKFASINPDESHDLADLVMTSMRDLAKRLEGRTMSSEQLLRAYPRELPEGPRGLWSEHETKPLGSMKWVDGDEHH